MDIRYLVSADFVEDCLNHPQRLVIIFTSLPEFISSDLFEEIVNLQQNITNIKFLQTQLLIIPFKTIMDLTNSL